MSEINPLTGKIPSMSRRDKFNSDRDQYCNLIRKAIKRRNAAREPSISPSLKRIRLESMRFWAGLAMKYCGGVRGSIRSNSGWVEGGIES